jgi:hypothetical protein
MIGVWLLRLVIALALVCFLGLVLVATVLQRDAGQYSAEDRLSDYPPAGGPSPKDDDPDSHLPTPEW